MTALAAATALALAALPDAALGQTIGPLDVRSRLGERFFAAVPVATPDGLIDPNCVRVLPNPHAPAGTQALEGARVRVGSADTVVIETAGTVMRPVLGLRLQVGCENPATRDFVVVDSSSAAAGTLAIEADPTARREPVPAAAAPAPAARTVAPPRAQAPARAARTTAPRAAQRAPAARPVSEAAGTARNSPSAAAAAPTAVPAPAPAASVETSAGASSDTKRRVTELRARSDDHAAALLALDDRLALLQKQAELLKAQLERALAAAPAQPSPTSAPENVAREDTAQMKTARESAARMQTAREGTAREDAAQVGASQASAAQPAPSVAVDAQPPTPAIARVEATGSQPATAAPSTQLTSSSVSANAEAARQPAASSTLAAAVAPAPEHPGRNRSVLDLLLDWKVAGGLAALLAGAFAFTLRRRPTFKPETDDAVVAPSDERAAPLPIHQGTEEVVLAPKSPVDTADWEVAPAIAGQTAEWVPPPTTDSLPLPEREMAATMPGAGMTREFHITQQFQPQAERIVAFSSPEEIVQQARTHYMDDNDVFKAIDLLEMAIAARKDSPRPWLALFAIYRRENMPERFQRLVLAYRGAFGLDEHWPAICALGQQMDASNPLYGDDAGSQPIPDDLIERWLGVPLDFTAHLLANEMHDQLMDTYPGRRRRRASE